MVQFGEVGEAVPVDLVLGGGGNDAIGDGAQGGRPAPIIPGWWPGWYARAASGPNGT